jgi:hypothetical protein
MIPSSKADLSRKCVSAQARQNLGEVDDQWHSSKKIYSHQVNLHSFFSRHSKHVPVNTALHTFNQPSVAKGEEKKPAEEIEQRQQVSAHEEEPLLV